MLLSIIRAALRLLSLARHLVRIALGWFERQGAYLLWIYTAFTLLLSALTVLLAFFAPQGSQNLYRWLRICLWMFVPGYRLDFRPLSVSQFWMIGLAPFFVVACFIIAFIMGRRGIVEIVVWERDQDRQRAYIHRQQIAMLSWLRVGAEYENEGLQYLRDRRKRDGDGSHFSHSSTTPTKILWHAGFSSMFYVPLSKFLGIPEIIPEKNVVNGSVVTEEIPVNLDKQTETREAMQQVQPECALFLLGTVRIRLSGLEAVNVHIKIFRQLELLAYLATKASDRQVTASTIATDIYSRRYPTKNSHQWLDRLQKDTVKLRETFQTAFHDAGIPAFDPISVGRGPGSIYQLADVFKVVDIARLEAVAKRVSRIKQERTGSIDKLRVVYDKLFETPFQGFLEELVRASEVGPWASHYADKYRDMNLQLIWDTAECETLYGEKLNGEEQQEAFRRAAQLYHKYAIATLPDVSELEEDELEEVEVSPLSERALQQSITILGRIGDTLTVDRIHGEYIEKVKRKAPSWVEDAQTKKIWQEAKSEKV